MDYSPPGSSVHVLDHSSARGEVIGSPLLTRFLSPQPTPANSSPSFPLRLPAFLCMIPGTLQSEAYNTMGTTHGFTTQLKKQTLQTQSWTVSLPRLTLLSLPWDPLSWLSMWPYHAFSFFPLKRKKKGSVGFFFLIWYIMDFLKCWSGDARGTGSIPGSGRSPGVGNGNPLQYSCLENSMDREAWQATVHGTAKTQTQLSTYACTCMYI